MSRNTQEQPRDEGQQSAGQRLFAGIELGGTKCICTLASGPQAIVDQVRIPTTVPDETLGLIGRTLDRWQDEHRLAALGIASFGPIDLDPASPSYGRIGATTKLAWRGADIGALGDARGLPVAIDTDVAGAALAEGQWGGATGLSNYAYITVGTGVGAGIVVAGRSVRGLGHPEVGHLRVGRAPGDHWPGACVYHGDCVEGLASGGAIEARAGRPAGEIAPDDALWDLVAHAIAGLCHNLVLTIAPQRILLGGGVPLRQPHLLPKVRHFLIDSLGGYGAAGLVAHDIDAFIAAPALGEQAGPLGPIALAFQHVGAKPAGDAAVGRGAFT